MIFQNEEIKLKYLSKKKLQKEQDVTDVDKKKTFLEERTKTINSNDLSAAAVWRILLYLFVCVDKFSLNLNGISLDIFGFWTSEDWLTYKCLPE